MRCRTMGLRDPLTIATSRDGLVFDHAAVVMSCTNLSDSVTGATTNCSVRHSGAYKNPGPSYPQGLAVIHPAPTTLRMLYIAASVNKEDIWVAGVEYASL